MVDETPDRLDQAEAIWSFLARMVAFIFGMVLIGFTVAFSTAGDTLKLAFLLVGVGCMWPVIGAGVLQAAAVLRGKRDE